MAHGTVKWFNETKGFGLIDADDGQEILVHHTAIVGDGRKTLKEGEHVEFEIQAGPQGPKAVKVKHAR